MRVVEVGSLLRAMSKVMSKAMSLIGDVDLCIISERRCARVVSHGR